MTSQSHPDSGAAGAGADSERGAPISSDVPRVPPGLADYEDLNVGRSLNGEHAIPLLPGTPSRSRSPPNSASNGGTSVASYVRRLYALLPGPVQNILGAAATLVRRNSRITLLAVIIGIILISASYVREEVQDWYEDHYEQDHDDHDYHEETRRPPPDWSAVKSIPSDGIKPGQMLVHPTQTDTLRAVVLELMVRFNRVTYQCKNLIKFGGSGSNMKGEGVWPVCFDGPYWQKQALQTYKHVDTESDKKNVGAKGNCVQYTFGVDWDFSFDDDFHRATGCDSHSFDPSMDMASKERAEHMYYWNMGISDKKGSIKGKGMRTGKVAKWEVDTIKGHMKRLKHNHLSLLKIDVEGFEWVVLREALDSGVMADVEQLAFEIHLWDGKGPFADEATRLEVLKLWYDIMAELEDVWGFRLVYVHTNGLSTRTDWGLGFDLFCCYEVVFFKPTPSNPALPSAEEEKSEGDGEKKKGSKKKDENKDDHEDHEGHEEGDHASNR